MTRYEVIVGLVALALLLLLALLFVPTVHSDYAFPVGVTGSLVYADSMDPIPNAWVITLRSRAEAENKWRLKRLRRSIESDIRQFGDEYVHRNWGGGQGKANGNFSFLVDVTWSRNRSALITFGSPEPPARHGIEALVIEIEGREPVILDAPTGTWTEHDGDDGLWATYDMGVVKVPRWP